ncbi:MULTISPECIES: hypothetical protein [unclassified Streptomyces]|uniref:hypothetical protein n=1 Tax=unclassified Streptomyces TaxID=2593676 RepID=UPI0003652EDD|nr:MULTISPECIES: hypothetical protein [unclassified Streptomyces]MYT32247.1 hypothetical protein [Streptomyces sp. SID8354]
MTNSPCPLPSDTTATVGEPAVAVTRPPAGNHEQHRPHPPLATDTPLARALTDPLVEHLHQDRRHPPTPGTDTHTASGTIGRPAPASAQKRQRLLAGPTEPFAGHPSTPGAR